MYKVFFKDRTVFFTRDFPTGKQKPKGLFYKYEDEEALGHLIHAYFYLDAIEELYLIHDDIELLWKAFKKSFKIIKAGGGLVRNSKNEILIIKRNGLWDLPKGKMDKGESFKETALREVSEECGIKPLDLEEKLHTTYHVYKLKANLILKKTKWYNMIYKGSENPVPQLEEDITSVIWAKPEELSYITGNTYSSIKEVLLKAEKN